MFAQENSFAKTANNIYSKSLRKSPYEGPAVAPFVVNACFAIEIYLKTILEAQGKKHKTHDLSKLHRALDTGTRQTIDLAAADVQHAAVCNLFNFGRHLVSATDY
jgi:hypothetical protein